VELVSNLIAPYTDVATAQAERGELPLVSKPITASTEQFGSSNFKSY